MGQAQGDKDYKLYLLDLFNTAHENQILFEPNSTHYLLYISENFGELNLKENLIFSYFINQKNCNISDIPLAKLESHHYPIIYGFSKNQKYLIYDNIKEKERILVCKENDKIVIKIKYKTIFKKEIEKNILIEETENNEIKANSGRKLALNKSIIIDDKIIYYLSSLFLSVSSPETKNLKILLNEDLFNFMEIYLKNLYNVKIEIIKENKPKIWIMIL